MKRGMDAVVSKMDRAMEAKRTPMLKRKPGIAIMIGVGSPKAGPPKPESDGEVCPECGYKHSKREKMGDDLSKSDKIAALEEKIAALKAELALLEDEDEDEDESDDEDEY